MSTATITADTDRPGLLRPLGLIAGISLIANLIVFAIGKVAGVDYEVTPGGQSEKQTINALVIAVMTVAPVLLGGLALLLTRTWRPRSWQVLAWVGLGLGIISIWSPAASDAANDTKVALSAMHLVVGGVWFWLVSRLAK